MVAPARTIDPSKDDDVVTVRGDIAGREAARRVVASGMERFWRIDTLINNAGIFIGKPFTEYTQADYAAITSVNVTGPFDKP